MSGNRWAGSKQPPMDEFVAAGQRVSLGVVETDRTAPLPPGDPCVASDVALAPSRRDWLRAMWLWLRRLQ